MGKQATKTQQGIAVYCRHDKLVPAVKLKPNPRNPNRHGESQIARLAHVIKVNGWRNPIIVSKRSGLVVKGHARLMVGLQLVDTVPVEHQDYENAEQETADLIADNYIAELSETVDQQLAELLTELRETSEESLKASGYMPQELDKLLRELSAQEQDQSEQRFTVYDAKDILEEAFRWYRASGFPYRNLPLHVCFQELNKLANVSDDALLNSDAGYHVADSFHPHRFAGHAKGMKSPIDSFNDDKALQKALRMQLEIGQTIGTGLPTSIQIVNGTQATANFRPGFALKLYREFCHPKGATVLDTSTGYGGRLIGFIASQRMGKYIGIDPSEKTHAGNMEMAKALRVDKQVTLVKAAIEDVDVTPWENKCDFAFTSPPYFTKEHYCDEQNQSASRYPDIDGWLNGFLKPMMTFQFAALKKGCKSAVNIAPIKLGQTQYALDELCIQQAMEAGFKLHERRDYAIPGGNMGSDERTPKTEPLLIFAKP